jgi:hypothetical protein
MSAEIVIIRWLSDGCAINLKIFARATGLIEFSYAKSVGANVIFFWETYTYYKTVFKMQSYNSLWEAF